MKIVLITQSDPFYLAENIQYLIDELPSNASIAATVLLNASPYGKQETLTKKIFKTFNLFGLKFFLFYGYKYIINCLTRSKSIRNILKKHNIPIIKLKESINHQDSIKLIKLFDPDLLVSIASNQIFKEQIFNLAPKGCLNLHCSLLPKYRGLMPSFWVLKNEEKETGVSVFFVDKGIDSGPIIVQEKISIPHFMTQEQLIRKTKKIGMDALVKAINLIHLGDYKLIPNNDEFKTYYSFPNSEDIKIFKKVGKKFF